MDTRWRIEMLGGLQVVHGDRTITRFRQQKTGALLAYLAYHRDRPHPREVLVELLWPDADPDAGHHNLRQALSSLRHQLEPPGVLPGQVIVTDRTFAHLNPEAVATDTADFEAALRDAERRRNSQESLRCLATAVDLYRGELLPGHYENWVIREQHRLRALFLAAAHRLLHGLEQNQETARALLVARRVVSVDPFVDEVAYRDLIHLLAVAGDADEALRQYGHLERLLLVKLSRTPEPETLALVDAIRNQKGCRPSSSPAHSHTPSPAVVSLSAGMAAFLLVEMNTCTLHTDDRLDVLRRTLRRFGGREVRQSGGSMALAFSRATDGLDAAVAAQRAIADLAPGPGGPPRPRMALHIGDIPAQKGGYPGGVLQRGMCLLEQAQDGQVLCSAETAAILRRSLHSGLAVTDLGAFRLMPEDEPEHIFQVDYPGMPETVLPPTWDQPIHAGHLPVSLTRFFGREKEIPRLMAQLTSEETRLLTMTGPGGSGKTRLALEAARRLADPFRGAVWFTALAPLSDPHLIPDAMLDALAVARSLARPSMDLVVETLEKQASLLLLDNFEHLARGGAGFVRTLLEEVPSLTCLVTSRHKLNLSGEREFPVLPLPTPEDGQKPEQLVQNESVQLFVDRAQAVRADFQVTERNAEALGRLCSRLEGIPLALELAAARAPVVSVGRMLDQLEHRFDALVNKRHTESRHATLRAALDWSYELLSPELQRFFDRLSVFRGGWTVEAAEAVCEERRPLDSLAQLLACSLILSNETADGMRFRMLETLREYGWQHLSEQEQDTVRQRHAEYVLGVADQALPEIYGPDAANCLDRMELEHNNIRAALDYIVTSDRPVRLGPQWVPAIVAFWGFHGHYREGRERLGALLASSRFEGQRAVQASMMVGSASMAQEQGDHDVSETLFRQSLAIYTDLGDDYHVAATLGNLGGAAFWRRRLDEARSYYVQALSLHREQNDRESEAMILGNLSSIALDQGDVDLAQAYCEEAMPILRDLGNRLFEGCILANLANIAYQRGDIGGALTWLREALVSNRDLGRRGWVGSNLIGIAFLLCKAGQVRSGAILVGGADTLMDALGVPKAAAEVDDCTSVADAARNELGDEGYAAAYAQGCAMGYEQAVAYALAESDVPA